MYVFRCTRRLVGQLISSQILNVHYYIPNGCDKESAKPHLAVQEGRETRLYAKPDIPTIVGKESAAEAGRTIIAGQLSLQHCGLKVPSDSSSLRVAGASRDGPGSSRLSSPRSEGHDEISGVRVPT